MSFAKIFKTSLDSSIARDWKCRIVFNDMLILADREGIVDMPADAIQRRTNIPMEIIAYAIPLLEASDDDSRSKDCEGRRIVRLEAGRAWGWRIVNFQKYRESATVEMTRMCEAIRKKLYRERYSKKKPSPYNPLPEQKEERGTEVEAEVSMDSPGQSGTFGKIPRNEQEAGEWSEMTGVPKAFGIQIFCQLEGRNWVDGAGQGVTNFRRHVKYRWTIDQSKQGEDKFGAPKARSIMDLKTIISTKQDLANGLKAKHTGEDAFGAKWNDETKRREFFQLHREIKELKTQLSNMA